MKKRYIIVVIILFFMLVWIKRYNNEFISVNDYAKKTQGESTDDIILTYDSFYDFPYKDMEFVDENVYELLKQSYAEIIFRGEFVQSNLDNTDFYVSIYRKLLKGEVTYLITETGEELYLNEDTDTMFADYNKCKFYFFDMDGNGQPELCVEGKGGIYVFKYDSGNDKVVLWLRENTNVSLMGALRMSWCWEGVRHGFYQFDESGEEVLTVFFSEDVFFTNGEPAYMVSFPKYSQGSGSVELTSEIKSQAYYDASADLYYFWVTEEQYIELTAEYFEALRQAEINCEYVKYSIQNYVSLEDVISGDYSGISDKETRQMIQDIVQQRLEEVEWIYGDLNGDNRLDLILQEKVQCEETNMNRIIGIFCVVDNEIICTLWDTADVTKFFCLCNNQLVYYNQYYGTFDKESYELYQYDRNWNIRLLEGMEVYYIEDMNEMPNDWSVNYPEMEKEGIYYMKFYVQENGDECQKVYVDIGEEQWKEEFGVLFNQEYSN